MGLVRRQTIDISEKALDIMRGVPDMQQASAIGAIAHPYSATSPMQEWLNLIGLSPAEVGQQLQLLRREGLRAVEQTTLLNAVTAYVDVVRDQAVVRLRDSNVEVLTEQLRQTKDRFNVGEVTRTDVARPRGAPV